MAEILGACLAYGTNRNRCPLTPQRCLDDENVVMMNPSNVNDLKGVRELSVIRPGSRSNQRQGVRRGRIPPAGTVQ